APQRVLLQEKKTPDDIEEVRFGADARTLMVGTNSPLQIARWKQESDGRWKDELGDLSDCTKPQSVAAGTSGASASFLSIDCMYDASTGGKLAFRKNETPDRLIRDMVWTTSGGAYVEMLRGPELIVRRPPSDTRISNAMLGSWIKGWQDPGVRYNHTSIIS